MTLLETIISFALSILAVIIGLQACVVVQRQMNRLKTTSDEINLHRNLFSSIVSDIHSSNTYSIAEDGKTLTLYTLSGDTLEYKCTDNEVFRNNQSRDYVGSRTQFLDNGDYITVEVETSMGTILFVQVAS